MRAAFVAIVALAAAAVASAQVTLLAPAGQGRAGSAGGAAAKNQREGERAKGGVAVDAGPAAAAELPAATQALLDEINRHRAAGAACGSAHKDPAPPMRWNSLLERAAAAHVRDMAPRNGGSIGHTGSNGSTVGTRTDAVGYRWSTVGENVAAGRATALATVAQWMASPGHCSNIMNPAFTEVGVAGLHLPGTTYNHYWVMVLARPMS
ncbi:MAG: CAP domain-containing protein [Rubrivivax sp.]|nr:CAP domain-containing protein [Rubrivivax sp.]